MASNAAKRKRHALPVDCEKMDNLDGPSTRRARLSSRMGGPSGGNVGECNPGTQEGSSSTNRETSTPKSKDLRSVKASHAPISTIPDSIFNLEMFRVKEIVGGDVFYIPNFIEEATANAWYGELDAIDTWYHPKLKVYGKEVTQSRAIAAYATSASLLARIKYSGHVVTVHGPEAYSSLLSRIQEMVERVAFLPASASTKTNTMDKDSTKHEKFSKADKKMTFNHVMLNRYACGGEYIGLHKDNKENKVIASLSLGAERTFIMTPTASKPKPSKLPKNAQRQDFSGGGSASISASSTNEGQSQVLNPKLHKWTLANGSLLIMRGETQERWKHEIPKEPKVTRGRISLTFRQLDFGVGDGEM